jgi:hypothetical protein
MIIFIGEIYFVYFYYFELKIIPKSLFSMDSIGFIINFFVSWCLCG